jgi:hypothetical protein
LNKIRKLSLLLSEIGLPSLAAFAVYRTKLRFGCFASSTLKKHKQFLNVPQNSDPFDKIAWLRFNHNVNVGNTSIEIADEITRGFYRPFGGESRELDLSLQQPLQDWTEYGDTVGNVDIKNIWEPARFTWALYLARAYSVTSKESYLESFWQYFKTFSTSNPAYLGPNWVSAQEVSLRAINWLMILPTLEQASCTTPDRMQLLRTSLWQHLLRIPPTIAYAKSQNNNHLLSEALGLYLLGDFFATEANLAKKWKLTGASLFEKALLEQIEPDGTYTQHSAVYHRLMLHLALLYDARCRLFGISLPVKVKEKLAAATTWMADLLDNESGQVPNLGHNDGTLLLPPGCSGYNDYRPTIQATSIAFRGAAVLPPGPWDSLSRFLNLPHASSDKVTTFTPSLYIHRIGQASQWAVLRGVQFKHRPAHADQLHVELWWDGHNIAQDAGTYSYNAPPPWQNALVSTRVHNTITIDHREQMMPAGKFLFLDRAQAHWLPNPDENTLSAYHRGYNNKGVTHTRTLSINPGQGFSIVDQVTMKNPKQPREVTLHWLLPDWQWAWQEGVLQLSHQNHHIDLSIKAFLTATDTSVTQSSVELVHAGETLIGQRKDEIMGWVSPTYGVKIPALSLSFTWKTSHSLSIHSNWLLRVDN